MGPVGSIKISGFRGIRDPLELNLRGGKSNWSMTIYGANGTGKSSIVDAWEWLCSGKIQHLAREDAGPKAYPHQLAADGETYIEVQCQDQQLGTVRMEHDPGRVTQPRVSGNLEELRRRLTHPCHLRYRDLTEFVYKTKSEKYQVLSRLIGYSQTVEIQDGLLTCSNQLRDQMDDLAHSTQEAANQYRQVAGHEPEGAPSFLRDANGIFGRHGLPPAEALSDVGARISQLRERVQTDETTRNLALWQNIQAALRSVYPLADIRQAGRDFHNDLKALREDEAKLSQLVLLDLYDQGARAIERLGIEDRCPLCDQPYEGSLLEHIRTKQHDLAGLAHRRTTLEAARKQLLSSLDDTISRLASASAAPPVAEFQPPLPEFYKSLPTVSRRLRVCRDALNAPLTAIDLQLDLAAELNSPEYGHLLACEPELRETVNTHVERLEGDSSRKTLVEDFQGVQTLRDSFDRWARVSQQQSRLERLVRDFEHIRSDYVQQARTAITAAFDAVASDVVTYFGVLERDAEAFQRPRLVIDAQRDKAAELEIVFGGAPVSPAYKVLSESQISSFGLAVFLASARNFNPTFPFMILDDVINSFDAHKRPRVVDLLREHFPHHQILLLTHDRLWLDRLHRAFPQWLRYDFVGWRYDTGPKKRLGKSTFERIQDSLGQDQPEEAGRAFGVYLEWVLRELCERVQAQVRFNSRNEFTLDALFQAFRTRMKDITPNHPLVELLSDFGTEIGFRNLCMHWKDVAIHLTAPEIAETVSKWRTIEARLECHKCGRFVEYREANDHEHIDCACGQLDLKHPAADAPACP